MILDPTRQLDRSSHLLHLLVAAAMFLTLAAVGTLSGCDRGESVVKGDSTISKIDRAPENYIGRDISLDGSIDEVFNAQAFDVESPRLFDDELLVIIPNDASMSGYLIEGRSVVVTGRVEQLTQGEVTARLGNPDSDAWVPVSFAGMRTVLVADSVRVMP